MTREDFCLKYKLTEKQFKGEEWVKRSLTIDEEFLPEGFNPMVIGVLELSNLKVIPLWFNPVVRWDLFLPSVISFNPSFDPVVGRWLNLDSLTEIPYGWKPTVHFLRLPSINTLPDWFEPVAWRVWVNDYKKCTEKFRPENGFYSWWGGKYIEVDWILTEVVRHEDNVFHVVEFGSDKIFYLVTDGNGIYAHGLTLSKAKTDLKFKLAKREGLERYKSLTLESVLSFDELITMYRHITGACQFGVEKFIEENKIENKSYNIGEVIVLTDGEYGNETFKNFFTENLVD